MKPTTQLYDKEGCHGFVKRDDGYWTIQDGRLLSMDDATGNRIDRYIKTIYVQKRTPDFVECISYFVACLKHRAAHAAYVISSKLLG